MGIDPEDAQQFGGRGGEFVSIRELLKPGEKNTARLIDIGKNFKTRFPIKDKDYNYRITLEVDGKRKLLDLNGADSIGQMIAALYPNGPTQPLSPCFAVLSRRTERKTYQSELQVERGDTLTGGGGDSDTLTL